MNRSLIALGLTLSLATVPGLVAAAFAVDPTVTAPTAASDKILVGKLRNTGTDDKPAWSLVVKDGDKEVTYDLEMAASVQIADTVNTAVAGANAQVLAAGAQVAAAVNQLGAANVDVSGTGIPSVKVDGGNVSIGGAGVPGVNIDASGNLQVTGADGANVNVSGGNVSVSGAGPDGANVKVDASSVSVSGAGVNVNVKLKGLLEAAKGKDTNVAVSGAVEEKDGKRILKVNSLVPEGK